jgi:hypothetical protein
MGGRLRSESTADFVGIRRNARGLALQTSMKAWIADTIGYGAVGAALDLLLGQQCEEAFNLIDP